MDFANFWFQDPATGPNHNLVGNSLRFRGGQQLDFYPTANSEPATFSFWVKRGRVSGSYQTILGRFVTPASLYVALNFNSDDTITSQNNANGTSTQSTGKYRDPGAWYHIVWQITGSQHVVYVNNVEIIRKNDDYGMWTNSYITIGKTASVGAGQFDGYLADFYASSAAVLPPTDFAEYDDNGVWVPKKFTGSYGTNGFHLDFSDPANIGADRSGNGNNLTPTGFELTDTSSTDYDWMADSPTDNFATINSIYRPYGPNQAVLPTYRDANLSMTNGTSSPQYVGQTIAITPDSPPIYMELTINSVSGGGGSLAAGATIFCDRTTAQSYTGVASYSLYSGAFDWSGGTGDSNGAGQQNAGMTIGLAIDRATNNVKWYLNGGYQGQGNPGNGALSDWYVVANSVTGSAVQCDWTANYGQRPFLYPPGTSSPTTAFNTVIYTGNGGSQPITGVGFEPDLVWIKCRSNNASNWLNDSVRGAGLSLASDTPEEEKAYQAYFNSFDSDGFTLDGGTLGFNTNTSTYVAWCFNAGDGDPVVRTDDGGGDASPYGNMNTTTVKSSSENGFAIATWTSDGTKDFIAHDLGVAPNFAIVKSLSSGDWYVYNDPGNGISYYTTLNSSASRVQSTNFWGNNTRLPTATKFPCSGAPINTSGQSYVAYLWANTEGKVSVGYYKPQVGQFIETGFRPAFVMTKPYYLESGQWTISDTARDPQGRLTKTLYPSSANGEDGTVNDIQITNNGFYINNGHNNSGASTAEMMYIAFAENFELDDVNDLTTSKLAKAPITKPNQHFQTLLSETDPRPNPPQIGAARGGGFFAGYVLSDDGASVEELIMAPKSGGELGPVTFSNSKPTNSVVPLMDNHNYGYPATEAYKNDADWTAFAWFDSPTGPNGTSLNGYSDWYLPAVNELQQLYWFFKPVTTSNVTASSLTGSTTVQNGNITNAIPDIPQWTSSVPAQTTLSNFVNGVGDHMAADIYSSATRFTDGSFTPGTYAIRFMNFDGGAQACNAGYSPNTRIRAIRRQFAYPADILANAQAIFPNGLYWIKDRDNSNDHQLVDSVRGGNLAIFSPATSAEASYLAPSGSSVAWCWNYNATNPTINGFEIIQYTGAGTPQDVAHRLGVTPDFVIVKDRDVDKDTRVWHSALGNNINGNNTRLTFNASTAAAADDTFYGFDSSVIKVGASSGSNTSGNDYIMYAWSAIPGYSAFGSYQGNNNANGSFIFTGFRVSWLMIKSVNFGSGSWRIVDATRSPYNVGWCDLRANSADSEAAHVAGTSNQVDLLSNGFKLRDALSETNQNYTYVYAAFAEHPFGGSNVFPANAR